MSGQSSRASTQDRESRSQVLFVPQNKQSVSVLQELGQEGAASGTGSALGSGPEDKTQVPPKQYWFCSGQSEFSLHSELEQPPIHPTTSPTITRTTRGDTTRVQRNISHSFLGSQISTLANNEAQPAIYYNTKKNRTVAIVRGRIGEKRFLYQRRIAQGA